MMFTQSVITLVNRVLIKDLRTQHQSPLWSDKVASFLQGYFSERYHSWLAPRSPRPDPFCVILVYTVALLMHPPYSGGTLEAILTLSLAKTPIVAAWDR